MFSCQILIIWNLKCPLKSYLNLETNLVRNGVETNPKRLFFVKKLVELSRSSGWATSRLVGLLVGLNGLSVGKKVDLLGLERSDFHSYEPVELMGNRLGTG